MRVEQNTIFGHRLAFWKIGHQAAAGYRSGDFRIFEVGVSGRVGDRTVYVARLLPCL